MIYKNEGIKSCLWVAKVPGLACLTITGAMKTTLTASHGNDPKSGATRYKEPRSYGSTYKKPPGSDISNTLNLFHFA